MLSPGKTSASFAEPDFAFPQQVSADAEAMLGQANALSGDQASLYRLRALLELGAATSSIDPDSAYSLPARIDEAASAANNSPSGRAMLLSLEASVLQTIYNANSWQIDRVDAPLEPYPAKVSLWSRQQFQTRIEALQDSALALATATPLQQYAEVLECDTIAYTYCPTVADFVRYLAVKSTDAFDNSDRRNALIESGLSEAAPNTPQQMFWLRCRWDNDYTQLLRSYNEHAEAESARLLLLRLTQMRVVEEEEDDVENEQSRRPLVGAKQLQMADLLEASLQRFPSWPGNSDLLMAYRQITRPRAQVTIQSIVAPGRETPLEIAYAYANSVKVEIFRVPDTFELYSDEAQNANLTLETTKEVTPDSLQGFATLETVFPTPGKYLIVTEINGQMSEERIVVTATPILPFTVSCGGNNYAVTANITTGAPASGVDVVRNTRNFTTGARGTNSCGRTDRKGIIAFEAPAASRSNQWLSFAVDGHSFDFDQAISVNHYRTPSESRENRAVVMTDRALYHQGDSLHWATVAYWTEGREHGLLTGKVLKKWLKVVLLDANWEEVDSVTVATDALGRADGVMAIPQGRLTGDYTLQIRYKDRVIGSTDVTVSDFKLPTIYIGDLSVERDAPAPGSVSIRGRVSTYSGMPVEGARITADVSRARRWWNFFYPQGPLGTIEATTEADGTFTLVADSTLTQPATNGTNFSAAITATTLNAETAEATANFALGKPLLLCPRFPAKVNGATASTATIFAYNADGENVPTEVKWQLRSKTGVIAARGTATAGTPFALNLASSPAGVYTIAVEATDATLADCAEEAQAVTLYNTATNSVPELEQPFFLPQDKIARSNSRNEAPMLIGITKEQATVYITVRNGDRLLSLQPYTLRGGFHTLNIKCGEPQEGRETEIQLTAVYDGQTYGEHVEVTAATEAPMVIEAETFRDRLVPGNTETWRLRLRRGSEGVADGGMIATMFNSALNALTPYRLPSPLHFSMYEPSLDVNRVYNTRRQIEALGQLARENEYFEIDWPEWLFLERMTPRYSNLYGYSSRFMCRMSMAEKNEDGAAEEYDLVADSAPAMAETGSVMNDAVTADDAAEPSAPAEPEPEVKYRDAEVLQAFFMPRLVSDSEGYIELSFTVPDANGSWTFNAYAWNAALQSATYDAVAVASRPVMVQPNLPRFLRQGDTAHLGTTVFNNTDSAMSVRTTIEIFNPATGEILASRFFVNDIAASGSAIVDIETTAAADAASVGYRVRAIAGAYTDGEQTAIPILPSEGTVVESHTFYLNATQEPYTLDIPVAPQTSYTLQYVSNPIWTVVKTLRGVNSQGGNSSTAIVGRLFSALAAGHIASRQPAITQAYEQWRTNPSDSALTSMLARNSSLKTLLLDQTPWVQASQSQSERMNALGAMFNAAEVNAAIARNRQGLAELMRADGGFAWGPWSSESSEWATRTVLTTLGLAKSLNMLNSDAELATMTQKAFDYLQRCVSKPNRPDTDTEFALICSLFPEFHPEGRAEAVLKGTVTHIAANWRRLSVLDKAYAVLILNANGKNSVAAEVLRSMSQFGVERAGQGMCFPSVNDIRSYATIIQAFATMGAPTSTLDAMRQWVMVQAEATDDLGAYNPDYVIASVMLTGTDWTAAPLAFGASLDGTPIASTALERATGYTVAPLEPTGSTMHLEIRPNGATPSYGSVTSVGQRVLSTVPAQSLPDLSVAKRFLVQRQGQWVETDSFALGERVRVQLILEVGRNMEYVAITDSRAATLAPVEQLPGFVYDGSLGFYRENGDSETHLFLDWLPAGTYHITYDMTANNAGRFSSGIATVQSQYAPELTAHSAGTTVVVR